MKTILLQGYPTPPTVSFTGSEFNNISYQNKVIEARISFNPQGLNISTNAANESGKVVFGESYWNDYTVTSHIRLVEGRSASLLVYFKDSKNYLSFGLSGNTYFLRSTKNGVSKDLVIPQFASYTTGTSITLKATVKNKRISAFVNGQPLFANIPVTEEAGMAGIKIWDPLIPAKADITSFAITPAQ